MKKQSSGWRIVLKWIVVISVLLVGLALTGGAVYFILRLVVGATLGRDMISDNGFYLAVVCMSLTVFLFLLVLVTRRWDALKTEHKDRR